MIRRRRSKHTATFKERLTEEAALFRKAAEEAPPGTPRELLLGRAGQAETASNMRDWLKSPGLQPPTVTPPQLAAFYDARATKGRGLRSHD